MSLNDNPVSVPPTTDAHRLARLLRHEVGDLLQSVYSTVGILLERMPESLTLERKLVSDLKSRAEQCKFEMDAVVELATPANLTTGRIDLMMTVHSALLQARRRFPNLQVHFDGGEPAYVATDTRGLSSCVRVLLFAICQGAQRQVWVRVNGGENIAEFSLQRDGYPASDELLCWLRQPFATTQNALLGVGLALSQRLVGATRGEVSATNMPEGGLTVTLRLGVQQ